MSQMRMSMVQPTPNAKARTRQEPDDSFMTLPDRELVDCLSDIGFSFTLADLQKPQPQQIQRIFEFFVELSMNATRTTVAPAMKAAADDICGEYSEVFSADTRDMMGFFVLLRRLLQECGVNDFTINDLYRPTRERLVKVFSHVINFLRFRESQSAITDEHFNKSEKTKARIEQLDNENQGKQEQLADLQRNRRTIEAEIADKENRSNALKTRLLELKREQERVSERLERVKNDQTRLKTALEERRIAKEAALAESQKLRPYTTQSPTDLENSLKQLNTALSADKAQIDILERRARALQTSTDAFTTITADVESCSTLLRDLQRDLDAEEATRRTASKNTETLSERSNEVRDMERREKQLQKQLENVLAKTEKVRAKADERRDADSRKMEELKQEHERLKREKEESNREVERRRARVEQTEKKMQAQKAEIEAEVGAAREQYRKMEAHVSLYMQSMTESLMEAEVH